MTKQEWFEFMCLNSKNLTIEFLAKFFAGSDFNYVVKVKPFLFHEFKRPYGMTKLDFWNNWKTNHMSNNILCLSSNDDDEEWWGFYEKEDALKFKLIWS